MTSRFNRTNTGPGDSEIARPPSTSKEDEPERPSRRGTSINTTGGADVLLDIDSHDQEPLLLPKLDLQTSSGNHPQKRQLFRRRLPSDDDEDEDGGKKKKSFCRTFCDMWFLLSQSRVGCIVLNAFLFGGGILIILLTALGGLQYCSELTGAVVFLYLVAALAITLGCLCCSYHWAQDNDDLPYGIFCVAYCLLFLFICITVSGTVIVFTRVHPVGTDQPPPDMPNGTSVLSNCTMTELPFGVLIVCYCVSIVLLFVAYCGCVLAFGSRHMED